LLIETRHARNSQEFTATTTPLARDDTVASGRVLGGRICNVKSTSSRMPSLTSTSLEPSTASSTGDGRDLITSTSGSDVASMPTMDAFYGDMTFVYLSRGSRVGLYSSKVKATRGTSVLTHSKLTIDVIEYIMSL